MVQLHGRVLMGNEITPHEGTVCETYADDNIGNGDPVILLPLVEDRAAKPILLGSGFAGYTDLAHQVGLVARGRDMTIDIPGDRASEIQESDADYFEVFTLGGNIETDAEFGRVD